MGESKGYKTSSGRVLTDAEIDTIADEVKSADYDVETLKRRRRGRPPMGSGPAQVVPVRLDPELRSALEAHAVSAEMSTSEVIRRAIRSYIEPV